jgi:hypothetical protein
MIKGLFDVYLVQLLRVEGIDIAGKQVLRKTKLERIQLKDHSIFVAFAPKDNQNCHRHFSGKWWLWKPLLDLLPV